MHVNGITMMSTFNSDWVSSEQSGNQQQQLSTEVVVPPLLVQQPRGTFNTSVTLSPNSLYKGYSEVSVCA